MAERAWSVGNTRHAATASRPAVTKSVDARARLSPASWRDTAMACCLLALAAARAAIPAALIAITVKAKRPAIPARRRRVLRVAAW